MEEIKRLQEEFARAQMSGSMAKLSERNCVEVIMMLQKRGMIELLYTMDGKQYITPAQLHTEIRNEVEYHGGRVNVVELHELVNVDLSRVEEAVAQMLSKDGQLALVHGDLIDRSYIEGIALEANDMLQEAGYLSLSKLCETFNLPFDYLSEKLEPMVGNVLKGKMDTMGNGAIYTDAFVARQTARLIGVFSAITRPTPLATILMRFPFHQQLFRSELDRLIGAGRLPGKLQGRGDKTEYVPSIQQRTQDRWIRSFYHENQYVEYDTVERLGIKKPKSMLGSMIKDGCALETCIVSPVIVENVRESIELALKEGAWVDVMTLLPSQCSTLDAEALITASPAFKRAPEAQIFCDSVVCSEAFILKCAESFKETMAAEAQKIATTAATQASGLVSSQPPQKSKADDADLPKSKKEKRKGKKKNKGTNQLGESMSEGGHVISAKKDEQQWSFLSPAEVEASLEADIEGCPPGMSAELANVLHRQLSARFQEFVRDAFRGGVTAADRREHTQSLENEWEATYAHTRLSQRGLEHIEPDGSGPLARFLLKDLGGKLLNVLVRLQAQESFVNCPSTSEMTPSQRKAVVAEIPAEARDALVGLESLLNSKTVDPFLDALEDAAMQLGLRVKRTDKRRDKKIVFDHRAGLVAQVEDATDPPTLLLLAVVLLFQQQSGCIIHAQGRSVSQIIKYLESESALSAQELEVVQEYQRKVMLALTKKDTENSDSDVITEEETAALKVLVKERKNKVDTNNP